MVPTWFTKTCLLLPATCWKWKLRCMYSCCKSPCSWCAHSNCTARSLTRTAGSFLGRGTLFANTQRAEVLRGSRSGKRLWGTCCQGKRWTWHRDAASIHHGFVCGLVFFPPVSAEHQTRFSEARGTGPAKILKKKSQQKSLSSLYS